MRVIFVMKARIHQLSMNAAMNVTYVLLDLVLQAQVPLKNVPCALILALEAWSATLTAHFMASAPQIQLRQVTHLTRMAMTVSTRLQHLVLFKSCNKITD